MTKRILTACAIALATIVMTQPAHAFLGGLGSHAGSLVGRDAAAAEGRARAHQGNEYGLNYGGQHRQPHQQFNYPAPAFRTGGWVEKNPESNPQGSASGQNHRFDRMGPAGNPDGAGREVDHTAGMSF